MQYVGVQRTCTCILSRKYLYIAIVCSRTLQERQGKFEYNISELLILYHSKDVL